MRGRITYKLRIEFQKKPHPVVGCFNINSNAEVFVGDITFRIGVRCVKHDVYLDILFWTVKIIHEMNRFGLFRENSIE